MQPAISKTARATSFGIDEEKLVEAVRGYPCLWKLTEKGYKDGKAKENAWVPCLWKLTEKGYKDGKAKENAWVAVAVEVRKYV